MKNWYRTVWITDEETIQEQVRTDIEYRTDEEALNEKLKKR